MSSDKAVFRWYLLGIGLGLAVVIGGVSGVVRASCSVEECDVSSCWYLGSEGFHDYMLGHAIKAFSNGGSGTVTDVDPVEQNKKRGATDGMLECAGALLTVKAGDCSGMMDDWGDIEDTFAKTFCQPPQGS